MATLFTNAESGTAGATVAQGTSYGGDAFQLISKSSGSTITIDATNGKQAHGTKSYRFVPSGDTGTAIAGFDFSGTPTSSCAFSFYINLDSLPTSSTSICHLRHASGQLISLVLTPSGTIQLQNSSAQTQLTTAALNVNTTYRVTMFADNSGGAGASIVKISVFQGDSSTAVSVLSSNTASIGTAAFAAARVGKMSTGGTAFNFNVDDVRVTYPATDLNGVESAGSAPSANAGGSKTTPVGTGVALNGSGSGTGTLSYSWSFLSADGGAQGTLTNANTANATVTPSAGGVLRYQLTVTDSSNGLATTDVATVYVPVASVRPMSVTSNPGGWSTTGAADAAVALADSDASTYTQSPDSPATAATERIRLAPLLAGTGFSLSIDHQLSAAGSGTAQVSLLEGGTVRKVWTISPTATTQTTTLTLTSSELSAITSLNALDVELSWSV